MTSGTSQQTAGIGRPRGRATRAAFVAFAVLAIVVWIGIAIGANARAPGVVGLAATVFGGLCAAVLTIAIGGAIALKLAAQEHAPEIARTDVDTPYPELAPALAELETLQRPVVRQLQERAAWRAPLGAAAGVILWSVFVALGAPGGVLDFSGVLLGGGLAVYGWAQMQASRENARIYSQRAVDVLASGMGGLNWRNTASVDLGRLRKAGVVPAATHLKTTGEIAGAHAGLSLRITPIETVAPSGGDKSAIFKGLLVEIETQQLAATSMEQLAALCPTAMAQIEQLATLPQLGKPVSAIVDGRFLLAIPETGPRVFDPPSQPGARAASPRLARIRQVVGAVLHVADALGKPA